MKKYFKLFAIVALMAFTFTACNKGEDIEPYATEGTQATEAETEATEADDNAGVEIQPVVEEKRVYVDVDWANDFLDKTDKKDYVLAEVTWGEEKDSPDYLTKHIPGAIHINTDLVEEGPIWNLRSPEEL